MMWKGEYQVPLFKLENCIEGQVWMKKSTNWSIEATKVDEQCRAKFCTTDCQFQYARCAYRTHHCEQFIGHFFYQSIMVWVGIFSLPCCGQPMEPYYLCSLHWSTIFNFCKRTRNDISFLLQEIIVDP